VTSCPYCIQNFEDSAKTASVSMEVMDVSEVIARTLGLDGAQG